MFAVVEFEKKECAIVPFCWLLDDNQKCYWPKTNSDENFVNIVKQQKEPRTSWCKYSIHKVFYITETYDEAEKFLTRTIEESSCDSGNKNNPTVLSLKDFGSGVSGVRNDKRTRSNSNSSSSSLSVEEERVLKKKSKITKENLDLSRSSPMPAFLDGVSACSSPRPRTIMLPSPSTTPTSLASTITNRTETSSTVSVNVEAVSLDNIPFQQYIVRSLEQLTAVVNENSKKIDEVLRLQSQSLPAPQAPANLPNFPIEDKKQFKAVEHFLQQEEHHEYLKCRLACIGGTSIRSCVMNMMKFLMTNRLAMKFNWAGHEKRPFKHTNLMKVISDATRHSFRGNHAYSFDLQDKTITDAVKDWLKLAKARYEYSQRKVPN